MAQVEVTEWLERRRGQRAPDRDLGAVNFAITTNVQNVKKTAGMWTIVTKGETIRLLRSALCIQPKVICSTNVASSRILQGPSAAGAGRVAELNQSVGNVTVNFVFRYIIMAVDER
jgi:hypothetical protein